MKKDETVFVRCESCGVVMDMQDVRAIENLLQRVSPGEIVPYGQCPDCGCLCHLAYLSWPEKRCWLLVKRYTRLWNAVENGDLEEEFSELREDFRKTVQEMKEG